MARPRGSTGPGRKPRSSSPAGPARRPRASSTSSKSKTTSSKKSSAASAGTPRSGSRFTTRAIVLLAVMVLLIASYTASLRTWWQQRQQIRATEAEIVMREETIAELKDDAQRWDDPAFIEQQARERFGWVLPGEVGYRVIDADGEVEGDGPQLSDPDGDEQQPWYDQLWESVEVAGQEPAPQADDSDDSTPSPTPTEPLQPETDEEAP